MDNRARKRRAASEEDNIMKIIMKTTQRFFSSRRERQGSSRIRLLSFAVANLGALTMGSLLLFNGTTAPAQTEPPSADKAKPADVANAGAKPLHKDGRPARLDMQIREDFFVGFTGDDARLTHGIKVCEQMMAKYPDFAEAMVWHGSGMVFQASKLFAKGDSKQGMTVWQKGLDEMDAAVKLEPNNISVLIPRAATLIPGARFINYKPLADSLWTRAASDYEKTYAVQKADFDKLDAHSKGELLFGLAEVNARLGKEEKARAYLKQIQQVCKATDYVTEAQSWLDRKTLTTGLPSRNCIGCHVK